MKARILAKQGNGDDVLLANETNVIGVLPLAKFAVSERETIKQLVSKGTKAKPFHHQVRRIGEEPIAFPPKPPRGWQLGKWAPLDRSKMESYNQTDYGFKAGSCLPNSLVNVLDWWDTGKVLEIPQERTRHKQVDWMHRMLSRAANTRNRGTSWSDLALGINELSEKRFAANYCFPCFRVKSITPAKLAYYTQGNAAVCMSLSVYYGRKYSSGHGVTVVSASANGDVVVHTWGLKIIGKLKAIDRIHKGRPSDLGQAYEIEIVNMSEMPEWFTTNETRFIIEPSRADRTYVFLPYERQKKGGTWRPHPRSVPRPEWPKPKKPLSPEDRQKIAENSSGTVKFKQLSSPLNRVWKSVDGRELKAFLTKVEGDTASFKVSSKKYNIPIEQFIPEDQIKIRFWHASTGPRFRLPASQLTYELVSKTGSQKIEVSYSGYGTVMVTIPSYREYRYHSGLNLVAMYSLSPRKLIGVAKFNRIKKKPPAGIAQPYHDKISKDYANWLYGAVNGFTARSSDVISATWHGRIQRSEMFQANVEASAVAEGLFYALGGDSRLSKIRDKRSVAYLIDNRVRVDNHAALRNLRDVAMRNMTLPVRFEWDTYQKQKRALRLVSIKPIKSVDYNLPPEALALKEEKVIRYVDGKAVEVPLR